MCPVFPVEFIYVSGSINYDKEQQKHTFFSPIKAGGVIDIVFYV
jgi:hypothetical protein